jgi:LDH2 family malate/lactate/ureidoglycolate dehydrogenase
LASDVLVSADARGIDSHGVARLAGYVRLFDNGRLNTKPQVKILHETPSTATLDGDRGLGLIVAPKAMEIACEKAALAGTGWVAVQNSNHFGIAGYHAMKALPMQMIGWAMTHAAPLVTPTFSKEKLLGTNPIAVAIPAKEEPAFVADFASTAVAYGKLEILQRKGLDTPDGWVQDANGDPCNDAFAIKNGGALLPLGGDREHGSHKGYGLGAIVDILSGVLSGANFGPWVPPFATAGFMQAGETVGNGTGHFLGAMRVDAFRPAEDFTNDMDKWIRRFRSAKAVEGKQVLIPGDPERELEAIRRVEGIPLLNPVVEDLKALASRFQLDFKID